MDGITLKIALSFLLLLGADRAVADKSGMWIVEVSQLPHQAGICDVIFAGTVLSTNYTDKSPISTSLELPAAEFAVDDVIWGTITSSNVTVGCIYPHDGFAFQRGERYLVCAFTNNWWADMGRFDTDYERLSDYLSVTGRPPRNAVFNDYRTMFPRDTAIPFRYLDYKGTNRWEATRDLVTNLVHIARVRRDDQLMRETIKTIIDDRTNPKCLPGHVIRNLKLYYSFRHDWKDNPIPTPQSP